MHFFSPWFPLLLVVVMGGYYALQPGQRVRQQNQLLLLASYVFYCSFDWTFGLALALSTYANFVLAARIGRSADRVRRRWLTASLVFNLGLLVYFKYLGFFVASASSALSMFGLELNWSLQHLWLPLGISFFTFQNLGYTLDVYKGRTAPVQSLADFALFVAFFPQLLMGPIERANRLVPQIQAARSPTPDSVREGAWLVFLGLTKKIVIADQIGTLVAPLFAEQTQYLAGDVAIAALLFTLQIYVDFSAYMDIAQGCARMLGFELSPNFRAPYLARNVREFWTRWHISLSSWVNEFLFMSLAVNPRWNKRLGISGLLIVTMVVMGFWHGASWMFLGWGLYHGLLLAAYHRMRPFLHRHSRFARPTAQHSWHLASVLLTFALVVFGELLFRPSGIGQSLAMFRDLLSNPGVTGSSLAAATTAIRLYSFILLLDLLEEYRGDDRGVLAWPFWLRRPLQLVMCYFLLDAFASQDGLVSAEFHYFRF